MSKIYLVVIALFLSVLSFSKDIYIKKSGSDNNSGTQTAPYLTISKAASVAQAGDQVFIGEGTYEETLEPTNSGTAGNPIIFQSIPGEKVIISAMEALSNWTSDGGEVYKTKVNWDLGQRNFVMYGTTALDLARWPNNTDSDRFTLNSLRNEGGSQDEVSVDAFLTSADIPDWDWSNGGSVMFYGDRPGSGWTTWKAWIKSQSSGRIDFDAIKNQSWIISAHPPGDIGDFFLEGIKEALDYQNEWYFDESTNSLYVILPGGVQPQDGEVAMAKRELVVNLKNKDYITIKNLAIFGGSVEIEGKGNTLYGITSLYGSMTRGITPNFNSGVNAVSVDWNAENTTIEKSEIGFGDGSGVWDSGKGTVIKNCYIHDFDMLGSYDAPLMVRGQSGAKVLNNTVTRGGRDALQIISKGSEVSYNDFSYSNLIADDCALLYTIGDNLNMDIHHNWFHDAEGRGKLKKAAGIYLDNDAGEVRVYRNVVWNVEWTNVQINWNGNNIDVFNNTLVKAQGGTMGAWHKDGTQFTNVKVWNNITDELAVDQGGNQETEGTWEPQSDKQNNLISKGSFLDWENNDFHLEAGSEAIDFGRQIDGYTDAFVGNAPDVGAYELGDNWVPGIDWDKTAGANDVCYGLPGESCSNDNVSFVDSVLILNDSSVFKEGQLSWGFDLAYSASESREVFIEVYDESNNWLGGVFKTVSKGLGMTSISIDFDVAPSVNQTYVINYHIRPLGTNWQDLIDNGIAYAFIDPLTYHIAPGLIEAENFETQFGTQKEITSDVGGGENIGYIENGDWIEYLIDVNSTDSYELDFRLSSGSTGGTILVYLDGLYELSLPVGNTGGWQDWENISTSIDLSEGRQNLRLVFEGADGFLLNLNKFEIKNSTITGVNNASNLGKNIYPNPTMGKVYLPKTIEGWKIYNLSGEKILETTLNEFDMSSFGSGLYFFRSGELLQKIQVK